MSVIYLKSNFEYLRGNYRKAMKMLGSAPSSQVFTDAGECLPVMYNNNLGCVHFHLRKHHLGAFYFRKALQENENALRDIKRGAEHSKKLYHHFEKCKMCYFIFGSHIKIILSFSYLYLCNSVSIMVVTRKLEKLLLT